MSLQSDQRSPHSSDFQDHQGEMKNNNKQALFAPNGDANANQIRADESGTKKGSEMEDLAALPPLVSQGEDQDKIIIWGTDSQCDDPDLEEFEMLECLEFEAYLEEEARESEKGTGVGCGSVSEQRLGSSDSAPKEAAMDKEVHWNGKEESAATWSVLDQESSSGGRGQTVCVTAADFSSENDIFVSCISTMSIFGGSIASALDSAGELQSLESQHISTEPYRTISEDLSLTSQSVPTAQVNNKGSKQAERTCHEAIETTTCVDVNLNSTVLSEESSLETEKSQNLKKSPSFESRPLEECSEDQVDTADVDLSLREHIQGKEGHLNGGEVKLRDDLSVIKHCNENTSFTKERLSKSNCSVGNQPRVEDVPDRGRDMQKTSQKMNDRLCRDEEACDMNCNQMKCQPIRTHTQPAPSDSRALSKQGSFEHGRSISPGLEKKAQLVRRPWGSPTRPVTPPSPKTTGSPRRRFPASPAKTASVRTLTQEHRDDWQGPGGSLKAPGKACAGSGIPKPVLQHPARPEEKGEPESRAGRSPPPTQPPKPKNVRPKIITSIRRSPQAKPHLPDVSYEASTLPPRLTSHIAGPTTRDPKASAQGRVLALSSPSTQPHDKCRPEAETGCGYNPDLVVSGVRPAGPVAPHRLTGKSESFCEELTERYQQERTQGATSLEDWSASALGRQRVTGGFGSPRVLRPQLGLGVMTRHPSTKNRPLLAGQRSALPFSYPTRAASPPAYSYQEATGDQRRVSSETAPRSLLPLPGVSGLRLPGYSRLPTTRLETFGFMRSASVSSVPSHQSNESIQNDANRTSHRLSSGSDDPSLHRVSVPPGEPRPQAPGRSSPHPPGAPTPSRRSLLPPPRGSPLPGRKEVQKDTGATRPLTSSPKRFAAVPPKPQSLVHSRQRPAVGARACVAGVLASSPRRGSPDSERQLVQLRGRCEEQERQLQGLRAELACTTQGLDAFAVATQHFYCKSEDAIVRERKLSLELARIKDEAASNVVRWERLQQDKEDLERSFDQELRVLRAQQAAELGALEAGLTAQHAAERDRMRVEQQAKLEMLHTQHREQIEEMNGNHEAVLSEMESTHTVTLAMLQEEHAKTVKELKEAHEQQTKCLEQDFEKLRLSLQDQVDMLTFQNRSLRDRAKRFEEALRRSTDEQIVDALAPYQHIKEDLKSLKEVLEMKNQQIHKQEKKISELEKMAQKNVVLEERVQVLQQQNEDLKARIDRNLAMSRQLSEENANLQVYVERESNEKKRLSRTNEELLWRLQTGELSPRLLSPSSSPIHHASPGPASPAHRATLGPSSPARFQPLPR